MLSVNIPELAAEPASRRSALFRVSIRSQILLLLRMTCSLQFTTLSVRLSRAEVYEITKS